VRDVGGSGKVGLGDRAGEATVGEHLRHAYERYGVSKRTLVAVHALFDGPIGFLDVLRR
jgi:LuxR family quorum-sensing system transcriptional regulator CciR